MNPKTIINGKEYIFIKNITDIITNRTAVLCEDKHGCSFVCDTEVWQGSAVKPKTEFNKYASPDQKIELFKSLFIGREDIYAKRFFNTKTGKSGYVPACENEWVQGVCDKKKYKCSTCPNRSFTTSPPREVPTTRPTATAMSRTSQRIFSVFLLRIW